MAKVTKVRKKKKKRKTRKTRSLKRREAKTKTLMKKVIVLRKMIFKKEMILI